MTEPGLGCLTASTRLCRVGDGGIEVKYFHGAIMGSADAAGTISAEYRRFLVVRPGLQRSRKNGQPEKQDSLVECTAAERAAAPTPGDHALPVKTKKTPGARAGTHKERVSSYRYR